MHLANCNLSTLQSAAKCFNCLSSTEKQALKTRFMAELLKASARVDYTDVRTLKTASACFECEPDFVLESMELAIWKSLAESLGASLPTAIADIRNLINCASCGEQKWQRAAQVFLLCQIDAAII